MERTLRDPEQWTRGDVPQLWLYNLHYFDDLLAEGADARRAWHEELIRRWIAENPPACGIGWDPYPTSLRIVNWIQWQLAGGSLSAQALDSLATQADWLARRMEFHLLGNHLWSNAKALIFAGAFFSGPKAHLWLRRGVRILSEQLEEQILPDGGHFERSPMYHAIVLADVLDLLQLVRVYPGLLDAPLLSKLAEAAPRMLRWARIMTHPDGEFAFFNDTAMGVAPRYRELRDYAKALAVDTQTHASPMTTQVTALPESGYVRLQRGPAVLIADVGEIGPDYQPGHAHADTLSFELSLYGQRVFVNGGVSTYEPCLNRLRQRGTAAHNTVVVDNLDSSEVWSSFRVGRRARPRAVSWGATKEALYLQGSHDGYRRLTRALTHARNWCLTDSALRIDDFIDGPFDCAQAMLLVHPDLDLFMSREGARVEWERCQLRMVANGASIQVRPSHWHPHFGIELPSWRVEAQARARRFSVVISWTSASESAGSMQSDRQNLRQQTGR